MELHPPITPLANDAPSVAPSRRRVLTLLGSGVLTVSLAVLADAESIWAKTKKKGKKKKKKKGNGGSGNNGGGGGGGGTGPADQALLLDKINAFRSANGKPALTRQAQLDIAAVKHSQDMANRNYFSHNSPPPDSTTPDQRIAAAGYTIEAWAENIYKGSGSLASAQAAFTAWQNSDDHRKNMLSTDVTQIGIGVAVDGAGFAYWTNTFGKSAN